MFCKTIPQGHCLVVERFGKPVRVANSGLHFFVPFFDSAKRVSEDWGGETNKNGIFVELTEQMVDTKPRSYFTKDNVQVSVDCICRWRIMDPIKAIYEVDHLHQPTRRCPAERISSLLSPQAARTMPVVERFPILAISRGVKVAFGSSKGQSKALAGAGRKM